MFPKKKQNKRDTKKNNTKGESYLNYAATIK